MQQETKQRVLSYMGLERMAKTIEFQIKRAKAKGHDTTILEERLREIKEAMRKS